MTWWRWALLVFGALFIVMSVVGARRPIGFRKEPMSSTESLSGTAAGALAVVGAWWDVAWIISLGGVVFLTPALIEAWRNSRDRGHDRLPGVAPHPSSRRAESTDAEPR